MFYEAVCRMIVNLWLQKSLEHRTAMQTPLYDTVTSFVPPNVINVFIT